MCSDDHQRKLRGIACPRCGGRKLATTHTEPLVDGRIRRRKRCRACGQRLVTCEVPLRALRSLDVARSFPIERGARTTAGSTV